MLLRIQVVLEFVKIISILDEELFSEAPSGAPLHTLSKWYDVSVGFVGPLPHLRQCIALFAIAEERLLRDIDFFFLCCFNTVVVILFFYTFTNTWA